MRLARLLDFLFPVRSDEDVVRDLSLDFFLSLVEPRPIPYTTPPTIALLPFHRREVRAAIHEAKYHGNTRAYEHLSRALADYLSDLDMLGEREACVIPLPLGRERMRARGSNQVEEIVRRAGIQGVPMETGLLFRTRETLSQTSLPKGERMENMRGAFSCRKAPDPAVLYILVDDVVTTGATLEAAIAALHEAGARHILPIALAH